jgi:hypothetical protein
MEFRGVPSPIQSPELDAISVILANLTSEKLMPDSYFDCDLF